MWPLLSACCAAVAFAGIPQSISPTTTQTGLCPPLYRGRNGGELIEGKSGSYVCTERKYGWESDSRGALSLHPLALRPWSYLPTSREALGCS